MSVGWTDGRRGRVQIRKLCSLQYNVEVDDYWNDTAFSASDLRLSRRRSLSLEEAGVLFVKLS